MRTIAWIMLVCAAAGDLDAQTQRVPMFVEDGPRAWLAVYADGNLKNALGQGSDGQLAAASLGLGIGVRNFSIDLLVNTIGADAAVTENFGTTLLAPASGSSLAAGLLDVRYMPGRQMQGNDVFGMGLRAYSSISSAEWKTDQQSDQLTGVVVAGLGVGGFATLHGNLGDGTENENPVGALLDAGFALRAIGGDIASEANSDRLDAAIPGAGKVRIGLELGLQLHIRGAKASLTYYAFGGSILGGDDVPGLTRGQVVAGFSVQSPLFQGFLSAGTRP